MPQIPFCGPTYNGRSVNIDATRSVNLYPEITGTQDNKTQLPMIGTPGTRQFATGLGANPCRVVHSFNNKIYTIVLDKLYSVDTNGAYSPVLGILSTSSGRVTIRDNGLAQSGVGGDQLLIIDGTAGYIYNVITNTFSTIASAAGWTNLLASSHYPQHAAYLDGYFIVVNGTMSFWVSNLYDGRTYNALATAPVIATNDPIVGVVGHRQQLFFLKQNSTEVWYNAGIPTTTGSPFIRVSGAVFDYGCVSKWSIATGGPSMFFLATQKMGNAGESVGVAEVTEYQPQIVSTPAISYKISTSTTLVNCFGYCYAEEGHVFYVLTNPDDDWTLVYDTTTKMWHERSSFCSDNTTVKRHVSNCYTYYNGKHYVGDYRSSSIYEMTSASFTDNGNTIWAFRTAQTMFEPTELNNVFVNLLAVDLATGVGFDTTQVVSVTPQIAGDDHVVNSRATITRTDIAAVADGFTTVAGDFSALPVSSKVKISGFSTGSINTSYIILTAVAGKITTSPAPAATAIAGSSITVYNYYDVLVLANGSYTAGALITGTATPTVSLAWSNDSGHTWSAEYSRSLGTYQAYKTRVRWRRLGYAGNRVFRLTMSSPCTRIIMGAYVEAGT